MDRMTVATSWVLVSGTLLLGGCMTPGFHNQATPGFSATYQAFDRRWETTVSVEHPVVHAGFEVEGGDLSEVSAFPDTPHEAELATVRAD